MMRPRIKPGGVARLQRRAAHTAVDVRERRVRHSPELDECTFCRQVDQERAAVQYEEARAYYAEMTGQEAP